MTKNVMGRVAVVCALSGAIGCGSASKSDAAAAAATGAQVAAVDVAGMDKSVLPGDDFFSYANGDWYKATQIPADRAGYGAWDIMSDTAQQRTRDIIEALAKPGAAKTPDEQKVGDYFASYMDEAAIEAKGMGPIQAFLKSIANIQDRKALAVWACSEVRADVDALNATDFYTDRIFGVWVSPAFDNPANYEPYFLQGGLSMPDRDYYLASEPAMQKIRDAYRAHVVAVLKLGGVADPERTADRVVALETKIARAHATRTQSMEVSRANNPWMRAEFKVKAPGMDWDACFDAAGLTSVPRVIVWHPTALKGISALIAREPIPVWKEYFTYHVLDRYSSLLPKAFADERFNFYSKVLSGVQEQSPRWKRAVDATSDVLGDAVGKVYVAKYFSAESKKRLQVMVRNITEAYDRRIGGLAWMAPETRAAAREKLKTLRVGIGYPDKWRDYSSLEIVRGEALMNSWRYSRFNYEDKRALIGKPIDRGEWVMTAQTVNAVNLPILNAMNFPAAILEPPIFNPAATLAANYGAIGAVIGHEISHSFDDQGSQFDAAGRFRNWWTPADLAHFKESSAKLVKQYNEYTPFPDLHVNGQLTLSENIADLAGLSAADDAYKKEMAGKPGPAVDGFTDEQQFFIAFGQTWRTKNREERDREQVMTDGHALDQYRAATVRNLDAWYNAFGVKTGQRLYLAPTDRARVW
jgi:predicted metalloendopeptidase